MQCRNFNFLRKLIFNNSFSDRWVPLIKTNDTIPIGNISIAAGREAIFNCEVNSTGRYNVNTVMIIGC